MKFIRKAFTVILLVIAFISIYQIVTTIQSNKKSSDFYKNLQTTIEPNSDAYKNFSNELIQEDNCPSIDFSELSLVNTDIKGWLYIAGTPINYPVVQGEDNQYYLKHLFNKENNVAGCIFIDANNNNLKDDNTILYGHHMRDDSMFSTLTDYKNQAYYDRHPTALFVTPDKKYLIKFFSGFVANTEDDAWQINFDSQNDKQRWIDNALQKSTFEANILPHMTDQIITLSTCSYEFQNARYVLVGTLNKL